MNYPTAIVIAAALIAGAIATTGARSADHEPAFAIVPDTRPNAAWRLNTRTGELSACGAMKRGVGCFPVKEMQMPQ